jgi:hypothetical protein
MIVNARNKTLQVEAQYVTGHWTATTLNVFVGEVP